MITVGEIVRYPKHCVAMGGDDGSDRGYLLAFPSEEIEP
jgi:hypothetical protein